jgi:uncharacterized RDD family membrane protein YckC
MYCPKCGTQNRDQAAFCNKCGAVLQKAGPTSAASSSSCPSAVQYAGFWRRVGAYVIDGFILNVAFMIVYGIFLGIAAITPNSDAETAVAYSVLIVCAVLSLLYWPLMESSSRQATVGKMAVGIIVTHIDGRRASFARSVGRNLGKLILVFWPLLLFIALTEKKQGLHDMMARCLVVVKKK